MTVVLRGLVILAAPMLLMICISLIVVDLLIQLHVNEHAWDMVHT